MKITQTSTGDIIAFEDSDKDIATFMHLSKNRFYKEDAYRDKHYGLVNAMRDVLIMTMYEKFIGRKIRFGLPELVEFIDPSKRSATFETTANPALLGMMDIVRFMQERQMRIRDEALSMVSITCKLTFEGTTFVHGGAQEHAGKSYFEAFGNMDIKMPDGKIIPMIDPD